MVCSLIGTPMNNGTCLQVSAAQYLDSVMMMNTYKITNAGMVKNNSIAPSTAREKDKIRVVVVESLACQL